MIEVGCGNDIPMCDSCGHRHIQGVRCSVCGHVGKSQIFTKMRAKASERRITRVGLMEGAEIDPVGISGQSYSYSLYQIAILLRNKALEQRGISVIMDQDPEARSDKLSSHVVCFGGDNPVAVSRWSIHQYTQNECTLLVDRLLVLGESVGRRFAYRCLYNVLHAALQQHVQYKQVDIYVPELQESQWVIQKLQSFGFVHVEQMHNSWHGLSSVNMRLLLNSPLQLTPGAPSLEDLLGFLLQKISA